MFKKRGFLLFNYFPLKIRNCILKNNILVVYKFATTLVKLLFSYILYLTLEDRFLILTVTAKKDLSNFFFFLKNHIFTRFLMFVDLIIIDRPGKKYRFELFYILQSVHYNTKIIIRTHISELTTMKSLSHIFVNLNWAERECWDMFGIFFINNNDLRRILTDYGFSGHPLRKDFPLTGFWEIFYDRKWRNIKYARVSLAQEYRSFLFLNPWHIK